MPDAVLTTIRSRLSTDSGFAERLGADFAGTLMSEGYLASLPIGDLPEVYRWHLSHAPAARREPMAASATDLHR